MYKVVAISIGSWNRILKGRANVSSIRFLNGLFCIVSSGECQRLSPVSRLIRSALCMRIIGLISFHMVNNEARKSAQMPPMQLLLHAVLTHMSLAG